MDRVVHPTDNTRTLNAPFSTHPHLLTKPTILPSRGVDTFSTATYIVLAVITLVIFGWAASRKNVNNARSARSAPLETAVLGAYLLIGLMVMLALSHHQYAHFAWIIVFGLLIPPVIIAFWGVYRYTKKD